jgi:hypothetical protein
VHAQARRCVPERVLHRRRTRVHAQADGCIPQGKVRVHIRPCSRRGDGGGGGDPPPPYRGSAGVHGGHSIPTGLHDDAPIAFAYRFTATSKQSLQVQSMTCDGWWGVAVEVIPASR